MAASVCAFPSLSSPTAEQIEKWAQEYLESDAGFDAVMYDLRD